MSSGEFKWGKIRSTANADDSNAPPRWQLELCAHFVTPLRGGDGGGVVTDGRLNVGTWINLEAKITSCFASILASRLL
jgi:hypothetical protein